MVIPPINPSKILTFFDIVSRFEGKMPDFAKEMIKNQLPHKSGHGPEDEAMFELLLMFLEEDEKCFLEFYSKLENFQKKKFRLTVLFMPNPPDEITTKDKTGKETTKKVSIEFTKKDNRIKYLKKIIAKIKNNGIDAVINELTKKQVFKETSISEKAISISKEGLENLEKYFFSKVGIDSWKKLDLETLQLLILEIKDKIEENQTLNEWNDKLEDFNQRVEDEIENEINKEEEKESRLFKWFKKNIIRLED